MAGVGALALAAAGHLGASYWTVGRFQVSTDDAYVQTDNKTIAPRVSGYLSAVLVDDNQPVKASQVLARIDDRDFAVALQQAKADVATAQANIADRQTALDAQQSVIDSARATIGVDQAQETFAEQDNHRYTMLAVDGWGTVQRAQEAASRIAACRAAVARDAAALANATKQIEVLTAQLAAAQAGLAHAQAVQAQAELNLSYTTIDVGRLCRHHRHQLRAGLHTLADTQGAVAHQPSVGATSPITRRRSSVSHPHQRRRPASAWPPGSPCSPA